MLTKIIYLLEDILSWYDISLCSVREDMVPPEGRHSEDGHEVSLFYNI